MKPVAIALALLVLATGAVHTAQAEDWRDRLKRSLNRGGPVTEQEAAGGIREAVEAVARELPVVLVTKGDLFHQEAKVAASGLADLFRRIEIVSEKDARAYSRVLAEFGVAPAGFAMVGNSLRSHIEPVVRLGGWGVHMPYEVTWAHELENGLEPAHRARIASVDAPAGIPRAVAGLQAKAVMA